MKHKLLETWLKKWYFWNYVNSNTFFRKVLQLNDIEIENNYYDAKLV